MDFANKVLKAFVITRANYVKENIHEMNKHTNLSRKAEMLIKRTKKV